MAKKENSINFITYVKRSKYKSLANLYDALRCSVRTINSVFSCHLITYPYISVMVECGDGDLLNTNLEKIRLAIETELWECQSR